VRRDVRGDHSLALSSAHSVPRAGWGLLVRTGLTIGGALVAAACATAPPLGLATTAPAALDSAHAPQQAMARVKPAEELYDRWGTRWCFGAGAPISGAPAIGPQGQIYVATHEGYLHALDRSGAFLWSYTVKGAIHVPPVILPNGAVVVATRQNLIYAFRPNGRRLWVYRVPETVQTPLAVSDKGTLVFGAGRTHGYAVSSLGGLVWRVKLPAAVTEIPPRLHKNGTVFMGTERGVVSWQAPTRQTLWESPPVESFVLGPGSSPERPAAGEPIWLASGRAFSSHGPMNLGDGLRFGRALPEGGELVSTRSELQWLGPSGAVARSVALGAEPSAPPLVASTGEVWVPSVDGTLLGVEPGASQARPLARIGFGPLTALALEGPDQIVAASGDGNVCSVSRARLGPHP